MDVDVRDLRYFVAVAEDLHFSRAAERLHLDQPTLSRHVRRLEHQLGVQLLDRTTRRVALTDAGQAFLTKAREAVNATDAALATAREAAAGLTGVLRVGMIGSVAAKLRTEALTQFEERYPRVALHVRGYTYTDPTCGLRSGDTDVALAWLPLKHPNVVAEPLFQEPRLFMVAATHPLASRDVLRLEDVEDESFFGIPGMEEDPTLLAWGDFFQLQPRPDGTRRPIGAVIENRDEWLDAIARGLAISTVPLSSVALFHWPGIVYIPAEGIEPVTIAVAWRRDGRNPLVSKFAELVREVNRAAGAVR